MSGNNKRKNKNFYANAAKKARNAGQGRALADNMKGFLLTCNKREKEAVREAYNLFNEYADRLIGPEITKNEKDEEDEDSGDDIDAALEKEKAGLVQLNSKKERRFQMVESGANNCIFIKTSIEDPVQLVETLVQDLFNSRQSKARFILRLIPILGTCKAYEKNMTELAETQLREYFKPGTSPTYSVIFKTRNNNQVKRDETINTFAKVVKSLNPDSKVEFKNPEICVVVEIIRNICCLGVVRNYFMYKKYNLVEMTKEEPENGAKEAESQLTEVESPLTTQGEDALREKDKPSESKVPEKCVNDSENVLNTENLEKGSHKEDNATVIKEEMEGKQSGENTDKLSSGTKEEKEENG